MIPARTLLPRIERAASVLLEVCDFCVGDAVAGVLLAAERHERQEIEAARPPRCCPRDCELCDCPAARHDLVTQPGGGA